MKKTFIFLGLTFFFSSALVQAQTPQIQRCHTVEYVKSIIAKNPAAAEGFKNAERRLNQVLAKPNGVKPMGDIYTIPVVFHVVYNNAEENISDAQILSQIKVLNEDYRRLNADKGNAPSVFQNVAGDAQIEFCLAQRTPTGASTNGITRTQTNKNGFSGNDDSIKSTAQGGQDNWAPTKYLNIWVCNLGSGLLGYATPPGGPPNLDGVVINYQYIGRTPENPFNNQNPYNLGRTATHEIGHWIGLQHTWGDDFGGCQQDDQVADTPKSADANYGCPNHPSPTCGNSGDMFMNYMDYVDDGCMNLFTNGQITRMRGTLENERITILSSDGCLPVTSPPVTNFIASQTNACPGSPIKFTDTSINGPTSWTWSFPNGQPSSFTGATPPNVVYATPGTYTVTLETCNQYGCDTETKTAYITIGTSGLALPFKEDFESGSFATKGWNVTNPDADEITWALADVQGISPGSKSAFMDFFDYGGQGLDYNGRRDGLSTPLLNFNGDYDQIKMTFDHAYCRYDQNGTDSLLIYVSTDCGATFPYRVLASGASPQGGLATRPRTQQPFVPQNAGDWCFELPVAPNCNVIDLTQFKGNDGVIVKFESWNGYQNNLYIDNINITGLSGTVTAGFTSNVTSGCAPLTVNFTDNSLGGATTWSWDVNNDGTADYTAQNPTHTYNQPGTYTVRLSASNGIGSDDEIKTDYIVVYGKPNAQISTDLIETAMNLPVAVSATPTGSGIDYSWNFNGGDASPGGNAAAHTVTWATKGLKTVQVMVTQNGCTSNPASKTVNITDPNGLDETTTDAPRFQVYPNPGSGRFTVRATGITNAETVEIFDITGRLVLSRKLTPTAPQTEFDLTESGVYLVKRKTTQGETTVKLIVR